MYADTNLNMNVHKTWLCDNKSCKQFKCPLARRWIPKRFMPVQQNITQQKKNKIMIHVTMWKNLKKSLASESSHMQKTAYCVIPIICNIQA